MITVSAGQLIRLDMSGFGLTCAFPSIALANLRELRQLYLDNNRLTVMHLFNEYRMLTQIEGRHYFTRQNHCSE